MSDLDEFNNMHVTPVSNVCQEIMINFRQTISDPFLLGW